MWLVRQSADDDKAKRERALGATTEDVRAIQDQEH